MNLYLLITVTLWSLYYGVYLRAFNSFSIRNYYTIASFFDRNSFKYPGKLVFLQFNLVISTTLDFSN